MALRLSCGAFSAKSRAQWSGTCETSISQSMSVGLNVVVVLSVLARLCSGCGRSEDCDGLDLGLGRTVSIDRGAVKMRDGGGVGI